MASSIPFHYYGVRPSDWSAGAHAWRLLFATRPDRKTEQAIEQAFRAAVADTPLEADGAPMGCAPDEPFLLVVGEERFPDDEEDHDWHAFFEAAADGFRAIHAVHPLREVVYLNARDTGSDPWEAATVAEQPRPTPCDAFSLQPLYWR